MREEVKRKQLEWPPSKVLLIALFAPLLLFLGTLPKLHSMYERRQIRKNSAMAVGTVVRYEYVKKKYRQYFRACVWYTADGKPFTVTARVQDRLSNQQLHAILNEKLPVIYEKGNPANGVVLANEERFGNFGLMLPDSLRWTRDYFY
ncbi:hypothetical protein ACO2Q8_20815 [Larkinella sp. VNQ87]|uniref:hypothetical protein n=1 Tax=Larkinella sp. VNQ87 TaxID=3400921 RepID=UPI003C0C519A